MSFLDESLKKVGSCTKVGRVIERLVYQKV